MIKIFHDIKSCAFKAENLTYAFTKKPLIHAAILAGAAGLSRALEEAKDAGTLSFSLPGAERILASAIVIGIIYICKNAVFGSGKDLEQQNN